MNSSGIMDIKEMADYLKMNEQTKAFHIFNRTGTKIKLIFES